MGRLKVAKQLCYRAVAANGGSKGEPRMSRSTDIPELHLLPFSTSLREHFSPRELRDWSTLLVERGVRIRTPIEEFLPAAEEVGDIVLPEDDELEDDELSFLRERQVLKPY
jgi:hypothetical protein